MEQPFIMPHLKRCSPFQNTDDLNIRLKNKNSKVFQGVSYQQQQLPSTLFWELTLARHYVLPICMVRFEMTFLNLAHTVSWCLSLSAMPVDLSHHSYETWWPFCRGPSQYSQLDLCSVAIKASRLISGLNIACLQSNSIKTFHGMFHSCDFISECVCAFCVIT